MTKKKKQVEPKSDDSQAIYGSHAWRVGEEETRKSLAEGHEKTFPNAKEAVEWLRRRIKCQFMNRRA